MSSPPAGCRRRWPIRTSFDCLHACDAEFGVPESLQAEIDASFERFKPAVVGSPAYRDVVQAQPQMDVTRGMASVGLAWPAKPVRDEARGG